MSDVPPPAGGDEKEEGSQPPPPPSSGPPPPPPPSGGYNPPPPPPSGGYNPPPPPPSGGYNPPPPPGGGYVPPPPGGYQPATGYGGYGYAAQRTDGLAIAALVLGLLSIVCSLGCLGLILGPTAAIMGFISRQRIASSGGSVGGGTLATVGLVLGIIGFVASVAFFFFIIVTGALNQSIASPSP